MSYTPTEWQSGDIVTSTKLNKLENGLAAAASGGGVMVVNTALNEAETAYVMDKTAGEIMSAAQTGLVVVGWLADGTGLTWIIPEVYDWGDGEIPRYTVKVTASGGQGSFDANTADDYPTFTPGDNGGGGGEGY